MSRVCVRHRLTSFDAFSTGHSRFGELSFSQRDVGGETAMARRPQGEEDTMKASIAIHVETLWTNRAELSVEAELDNPHSGTNQEVISMMFEVARMMTTEARGENERALFSQAAVNDRYRELDEREARLDERDKRVTSREATATERDTYADERERDANTRERDQMEHDVRLREQ